MTRRVPRACLWLAGVFHHAAPPQLTEERLTTPLRSAPVVLREMRPAVGKLSGGVHDYSDLDLPAPGDGLRVVRLSHRGFAPHATQWPVDCPRCGQDVAAELRRLGVGSGGESGLDYTAAGGGGGGGGGGDDGDGGGGG